MSNLFDQSTEIFDPTPKLGAVPVMAILSVLKGGIDRQIELSNSIDQARQIIQQKADAINQAKRHLADLEKELTARNKLSGFYSNFVDNLNEEKDTSKTSEDARLDVDSFIPTPAVLVVNDKGETKYGRAEIREFFNAQFSSALQSKREKIKWFLDGQSCWIAGKTPIRLRNGECTNLPGKRFPWNKKVLEDHIEIATNQDRIMQAMMAYINSLEGKVDYARETEFQNKSILSSSGAIRASVSNVGIGLVALLGLGIFFSPSKNKPLKPKVK